MSNKANLLKTNSRVWDDVAAELLSTVAPYGLALLSVVMIGASASEEYALLTHWHPVALAVAAFFMVISGLAIYSTTFDIIFNDKLAWPIKVIAGACALVYTATFAVMVLVLKLHLTGVPAWVTQLQQMLPFAAMVLLDAASITNLTIRRKTYRVTTPGATARGSRKTGRKPTEQTNEERLANLDAANASRQPTAADFRRAAQLRAEGLTWPQIGQEIERSESTAKRWASLAGSNGNGNGGI